MIAMALAAPGAGRADSRPRRATSLQAEIDLLRCAMSWAVSPLTAQPRRVEMADRVAAMYAAVL
jgi:hypothetical protein